MEDWTMKDGSESIESEQYLEIISEIERTIYASAHDLIWGNINEVSRLIASRLAHKHKMVPYNPPPDR